MSEDERAIREFVDVWMRASRASDIATLLSLMTDDVIFLAPDRLPLGRDAFAAAFEAMKGIDIDATSDIQEIQVCGDWAYTRSHLEIAMTPKGGETARRSGYTLAIMRKESDGRWRLARNANLIV